MPRNVGAIRDIELGARTYFIRVGDKVTQVYVKQGSRGEYLATSQGGVSRNNLDDLPDCRTRYRLGRPSRNRWLFGHECLLEDHSHGVHGLATKTRLRPD